ncbi:ABC transporter ATP-binding protein [Sporomusa acidovorans]|uniref:ABC transporter ATP-binding protein n=1 Tax=Sporomusa acidovorans (strain ATCC 49682 / DSM 3132 / Mol) TaxID=1123286 RepID=A0ABZ3J172_SPOA4|nr:ABC transporter ATP-binding protein [Sporomusa acidovorans]OZC14444.1 putative ABC transporter ATP-binding protein [Sporomusa acidovorans DSM 3132]SDF50225.1 Fe-S cluster assembly ATP-binding protein [Sporomusa acidovorans]
MLRLEGISVAVDGRQILQDVNLHIKPGEVHVLFGPNGTGKSTLIGAIMGFARYTVTAGKIYFKGQDITHLPVDERARRGIGVMIQRPPTLRGLSVREMVQICGKNQVEVESLAEKMNMVDFLARGVNEGFSGGEIKRSELLQLMAQQPDFVMLDEPESGVDIENIAVVGQAANYILERGTRKNGQTIKRRRTDRQKSGLIITHTGHIMEYVPADIAHVMYQGTLSCSGNPQEMLACIHEKGYEECINCAL